MKTSARDLPAAPLRRLRAALLVLAWLAIAASLPVRAGEGDTLVQFSTIDALLAGLYDGVTDVATLRTHGDFGIGTFAGIDGEMVVLDGLVYRVSSDGRAPVAANHETTPFAAVTHFRPDRTLTIPAGTDFDTLQKLLDAALPSVNLFHAIRGEGRFRVMRTRSVPRQTKPYRPLVEVIKEQSVFDFSDVAGVLVGLYAPPLAKGVNSPGYHLHFLTADRAAGGHVLGFTTERLDLQIDTLSRWQINLPTSGGFATADLGPDRQDELDRVEGPH